MSEVNIETMDRVWAAGELPEAWVHDNKPDPKYYYATGCAGQVDVALAQATCSGARCASSGITRASRCGSRLPCSNSSAGARAYALTRNNFHNLRLAVVSEVALRGLPDVAVAAPREVQPVYCEGIRTVLPREAFVPYVDGTAYFASGHHIGTEMLYVMGAVAEAMCAEVARLRSKERDGGFGE